MSDEKKMDADTLQALRESIAHWDRLASGHRLLGETIGTGNCALCRKFYDLLGDSCVGCPVRNRTGKPFCLGSDYEAIEDLNDSSDGPLDLDSREFKIAALRELEFLRSLVPPS